jgi:predicted O-methyltransferase YrrM
MIDPTAISLPAAYTAILELTQQAGFTMSSDPMTGSLLKTLAASKPGGRFLELGTGTGLSTAWISAGIDQQSTLVTVDHDPNLLQIAQQFLGSDQRISFVLADGGDFLATQLNQRYDYIFADTWHGKYLLLNETLLLLNPGALYIIDDMLPQPNWPDGHEAKVIALTAELLARPDLVITNLHWASGIIIGVKQ